MEEIRAKREKNLKKTYQHIQTEEEDEGGQGGNPSLQVGRGRVLSEARKIDPFMPASVSEPSIQETPIELLVAASCNYSRFPTRPQQGMGIYRSCSLRV